MTKAIYVTRPHLPPLEEFLPYLERIWKSKVITNGGPFHQELESALCEYLGVDYVSLFSNGTLALVTALKALGVTGDVITTPYSFVATSHSILWNNARPIFVDIDPQTFNLNANELENAITPETTAILPVHCYGIPCEVEKIQNFAERHRLKVIYDAAHAFGVSFNGQSLLRYGDLSVLSFHATKVFNTFEGGCIVCHDETLKQRIDYLKNFGLENETSVVDLGINGKMNEISAAFGLLQLKDIDVVISRRQEIEDFYRVNLSGIPAISIPPKPKLTVGNSAYFPIIIDDNSAMDRDALFEFLKTQNIFCRRYFYPLISEFAMYRSLPGARRSHLPHATLCAEKVLCLPIYPSLKQGDLKRITSIIKTIYA